MKTFLDFSLGFVFGLLVYYVVGFLGALTIATAGFIVGNLIVRYVEKRRRK